jgi:uncharacterized protein with von Willebrand factor type A (vWA) domain
MVHLIGAALQQAHRLEVFVFSSQIQNGSQISFFEPFFPNLLSL